MSQNPLSVGTDYETLANRFRPLFRQIAAGTVEREQARDLPFEPIRWLKEAGFGAVRVPVEFGGAGASISQLFQLLIELAEADSNIVQSLRGHFAFVEDRLNAPPSPARDAWFARFVAGDLVGNGWTEIGAVKIGEVITKVRPEGENFVLNGAKYYSTGSIFADWVDVYAQRSDNGADVIAIVDARHSGVSHSDDWDGFGQRTTGSGTSLYVEVPLSAEQVIPFETRFKYQTAFYQLVLLAVLAGIGRAVERDVAHEVRTRKRVFSQGSADTTHGDPQIQQVVGQSRHRSTPPKRPPCARQNRCNALTLRVLPTMPKPNAKPISTPKLKRPRPRSWSRNWCCGQPPTCSMRWVPRGSALTSRWTVTGVCPHRRFA